MHRRSNAAAVSPVGFVWQLMKMARQPLMPSRLRQSPPADRPALKDDLLYGAQEIRDYLRLRDVRQVFRLRQRGHAPIFNTPGIGLTARKSALDAYFDRLEAGSGAR